MRKCTRIWTTREGEKVRVCDMADSHLMNTLLFLWRHAKLRHWACLLSAYQAQNFVNGDGATMAIENAVSQLEDESELDYVPDIWFAMRDDAHRRGLVDMFWTPAAT